jgi:hypothetical protein
MFIMDNNTKTSVIGNDIPWKDVEEKPLRVVTFTPLGLIENGKIKTTSTNLPYALLSVESPILPQQSQIWVVNKVVDILMRESRLFNVR